MSDVDQLVLELNQARESVRVLFSRIDRAARGAHTSDDLIRLREALQEFRDVCAEPPMRPAWLPTGRRNVVACRACGTEALDDDTQHKRDHRCPWLL